MCSFDVEGFSSDYDAAVSSGDKEAIEWLESHVDVYIDEDSEE